MSMNDIWLGDGVWYIINQRGDDMDCKKVISQVMLERNINYDELAEKLGMKTQSLRNKISRGNYSMSDFIEMMNILNCDVQVKTRDTEKVFD